MCPADSVEASEVIRAAGQHQCVHIGRQPRPDCSGRCSTWMSNIRPASHNPTHPAFLSGPQTLLILSKLIDSFHCNIDYQVFGGQQPKNTRTAFDDDFCHSHFLQKVIQNIAKNFSFSRRCWPRTVVDTGLFARLCLFTFGLGHRHRPSGPACMPVCQASPSHTHTYTFV